MSALLTATDCNAAQSSSDEELSLAAMCQDKLGVAAHGTLTFHSADSCKLADSQALLQMLLACEQWAFRAWPR